MAGPTPPAAEPAELPKAEPRPELEAPEEPLELEAHEEPLELEAHHGRLAIDTPEADPTDAAPATVPAAEPAAAHETPPAPATSGWVPPPTQPPSGMGWPRNGKRASRPSPTLALGVVLIVLGLFFLLIRLYNIDLSSYGWPLYVIIPGLTLLVVGFVSLGTGAVVPGGIVTMAGLVLAYQNATGDWASWSYAWALVAPGGVGIGIFLSGLRDHNERQLRQGRSLIFWSALIFMIGFVFFESILNISGVDYGVLGRAALPALLIVIGVTLLVRSYRNTRTASAIKP